MKVCGDPLSPNTNVSPVTIRSACNLTIPLPSLFELSRHHLHWQDTDRKYFALRSVIEMAKAEFDSLVESHQSSENSEFNNDKTYQRFTNEAIESKGTALKKIQVYSQMIDKNNDGLLQRIKDTPVEEFARESTVMELLTGLVGFPWAQVMSNSSALDFGSWSLEGIEDSNFKVILQKLEDNSQVRTVSIGVGLERLLLNDGWATSSIAWSSSPAVSASPAIVGMLMRCCTCLTSLNLGYKLPTHYVPVVLISFSSFL